MDTASAPTQSLKNYHQHLSLHLAHLLKRVNAPSLPLDVLQTSESQLSHTPPALPGRTTTSTSDGSNITLISSVSSSAESRELNRHPPNAEQSTNSASGSGNNPLSQGVISKDNSLSFSTAISPILSSKRDSKGKQRMRSHGEDDGSVESLKEDDEGGVEEGFPAHERTARPALVSRSSNLISQELLYDPNPRAGHSASESNVPLDTADDEDPDPKDEADSFGIDGTSSSPPNEETSTTTLDEVSESLSREEEHARAWQTDGRRVWKVLPEGFQLSLDGKSKPRRSSESVHLSSLVGLGCTPNQEPGTLVDGRISGSRPDNRIVETPKKEARPGDPEWEDVEITPQPRFYAAVPSPDAPSTSPGMVHTLKFQKSSSHLSAGDLTSPTLRPAIARPQTASPSYPEVSPSQTSVSLTRSSFPAVPGLVKICSSSTPSLPNLRNAILSQPGEKTETDRGTKEDYESKRVAKLRKNERQLADRVGRWLGSLDDELVLQSPPEIHPNIPSPSLTTTLLRFEPLPAGFPPQDSTKTYNFLPNRRLTSASPNHGSSKLPLGDFIKLSDLPSISATHSESIPPNDTAVSKRAGLGKVQVALGGKGKRLGLGGRLTDLDVELAIRLQALEALTIGSPTNFGERRGV